METPNPPQPERPQRDRPWNPVGAGSRIGVAILSVGLVTVLLLAGIAAAQPSDQRPSARDPATTDRPGHDAAVERPDVARYPLLAGQGAKFSISLEGTATGTDNESLHVSLLGAGIARTFVKDGQLVGLMGIAKVEMKTSAADNLSASETATGTIKLAARQVGDDQWRWMAASRPDRQDGTLRLVMHGVGQTPVNASIALEGVGKAWYAVEGDRAPDKLDLIMAGSISRSSSEQPDRQRFTLLVAGNGNDAQNRTFEIILEGRGQLLFVRSSDRAGLHGFAKVHGLVSDSDGVVVKNDTFVVKIRAVSDADGQWRWQLVSTSDRGFFGLPALMMRGTAEAGDDALTIEGHGFAAFKTIQDERLRLRLDVDGLVTAA